MKSQNEKSQTISISTHYNYLIRLNINSTILEFAI
jgi:hypothetical protein